MKIIQQHSTWYFFSLVLYIILCSTHDSLQQLKTTKKIFMCLFAPFILQKFLEPIQIYEDVPFSGPKWHTCPEQFFWYKPLLSLSSTYWPFSLCKSFKNSYSGARVRGCAIFGPKTVHLTQTKIFQKLINIVLIYLLGLFRKPVDEPCFFHLCLSSCQNSNLAERNIHD